MGNHLPRQVRSALRAWLTPLRKPQQPQALIYLSDEWAVAERNWTSCGLAYNLVVLWNGKRRRSFGTMLRAFRKAVSSDELIQLHQHLVKAQ